MLDLSWQPPQGQGKPNEVEYLQDIYWGEGANAEFLRGDMLSVYHHELEHEAQQAMDCDYSSGAEAQCKFLNFPHCHSLMAFAGLTCRPVSSSSVLSVQQ